MIGMYLGIFAYCIGVILILTLATEEVNPGDMPIRLKVGVALFAIGGILICAGALYTAIVDPTSLLEFGDFIKSLHHSWDR